MRRFGYLRIISRPVAFLGRAMPASALTLLLLPFTAAAQGSATLELSEAWVRAMPPTQRMTAAYLRIDNPSAEVVTISSVTASRGQASLHETRVEGGRSMMRAVSGQTIAAGGMLTLEPGGMHIMIMALDKAPAEGETLTLCVGSPVGETCIDAPVRRSAPEARHGHHDHQTRGR